MVVRTVFLALLAVLLNTAPMTPSFGADSDSASPTLLKTVPDVRKQLFIQHPNSRRLTLLNTADDSVTGDIALAVTPLKAEIALSTNLLAAIDGVTPQLALHRLDLGNDQILPLFFVPDLLTVTLDGRKLAVGDRKSGQAVLLPLTGEDKVPVALGQFPGLSDLMFSADGIRLVLAGDHLWEINTTDTDDRKSAAVATRSLARSPDGYTLFGKTQAGPVVLFNARTLEELKRIPASAAAIAYPSATGTSLLLVDGAAHKITLLGGDPLDVIKRFSSRADTPTVYSGWFDSLALIPSQSGKAVEMIDLWKAAKQPDLSLPAAPLPGAVTSDGAKLYLPLAGEGRVAVIDLRERTILKILPLSQPASAAFMAESYGICH